MASVSDEYMTSVLRPFVAATGPVLRGLRDADPFRLGRLAERRAIMAEADGDVAPASGAKRSRPKRALGFLRRVRGRALDRLATSRLPGTPRWQVMTPEEHDRWWVGRVGRFTSAIAAVPGIGGALARRLPVSAILGLSAQGLVVCAIATDHGLTDRDDQVRLLATVLFDRDLRPVGDPRAEQVERDAADLTGPLPTRPDGEQDGVVTHLARSVWRMGRSLFALNDELGRRPQGKRFWRLVANVPVIGVLGAYKSERSGLKRAAREAAQWVAREQGRAA